MSADEQRQQWDSVATGWKKWWPTIENGAQIVSTRLIEWANVGPGQRVLDIATGIGEPALLAASRVGDAGRVVATDLSSRMLDIARERAAAAGLTNVEFHEADAGRLDFPDDSFDAVLWRWGPTDVPDVAKALTGIRRMLRQGGTFATAVWEAGPKARPLASLAMRVAEDVLGIPPAPPEESSPLGDWLEQELRNAGFLHVHVEAVRLTLTFASTDDCAQYLADVSPLSAAVLSGRSPAQLAQFRLGLAATLEQYVAADGSVRIPNVTLCAAGRK